MEQKSEAGNTASTLIATGETVRIIGEVAEGITIYAVADRDPKRLGEATEAEFIARGAEYKFRLAKPWGDSDSYDVLVGMGRGFWRVQVKRATYSRGEYVTNAGSRRGLYTKENIDFIAAHLTVENIWYIVPVEAFQGCRGLQFNPHTRRQRKYEKYREAWCLLACPPKARGWKDIPAVCRCRELEARCAVCPNRM